MKTIIAIIALSGLSFSLMAQPYYQRQRQFQEQPFRQHQFQQQPFRQHQFQQQPFQQQPFRQMNQYGFAALDLTDEQEAEIKEIHLTRIKAIQSLRDEININRAKINALVNKNNPDMKEIVSLVEVNGNILTQISVKEIENKTKVRALLTDEQKVIFDARYSRMYGRRGMYGGSRMYGNNRMYGRRGMYGRNGMAQCRPQRRIPYGNRF